MEIFPNCRRTLVVLDEKYAREFPRVISSFRLEDIVNRAESAIGKGEGQQDSLGIR